MLFNHLEKHPLTEKQCQACQSEALTTLVLAGAGTGKTSTLMGRIVYLWETGRALAHEVLPLAFAVDAANEVQQRVTQVAKKHFSGLDISSFNARTFHSLGWHIVQTVERKTPKLTIYQDEERLLDFLQQQFWHLVNTNENYRWWLFLYFTFCEGKQDEDASFAATREDSKQPVPQPCPLRSLHDDYVSNRTELVIANLLYLLGIPYIYGAHYKHNLYLSKPYQPYRCSFYLPQSDRYIEVEPCNTQAELPLKKDDLSKRDKKKNKGSQLGSRSGKVEREKREGLDNMSQREKWEKREGLFNIFSLFQQRRVDNFCFKFKRNRHCNNPRNIHQQYGTQCLFIKEPWGQYLFSLDNVLFRFDLSIPFSHSQGILGDLLEILQKLFIKLKGQGSIEEILKPYNISLCDLSLANLVRAEETFESTESSTKSKEAPQAMRCPVEAEEIFRQKQQHLLYTLLAPLWNAYAQELRQREELDFDDMIVKATKYIEQGYFQVPWKEVLVDEFQDISQARMHLIQAMRLQKPDLRLFCVGDDWQTIYQFAGSELVFIRYIERYLGETYKLSLDKTFRFHQGLCDISSKFVQQNPMQYRKRLTALREKKESVVLVALTGDEASNQARRIAEIQQMTGTKNIFNHDTTSTINAVSLLDRDTQRSSGAMDTARAVGVMDTTRAVGAMDTTRAVGAMDTTRAVGAIDSTRAAGALEEVVQRIVEDIQEKKSSSLVSCLFLARFHHDLPSEEQLHIWQQRYSFLSLRAATIHASKGTEADFVIVLNVNQGELGLPSAKQDKLSWVDTEVLVETGNLDSKRQFLKDVHNNKPLPQSLNNKRGTVDSNTSYEETSYHNTSHGDTFYGDTSYGDTSYEETSYHNASYDSPPLGKVFYDNASLGNAFCDNIIPFIENFPYAEERRVFYVALTRAKECVYLCYHPDKPSIFLTELQQYQALRQLSLSTRLHITSYWIRVKEMTRLQSSLDTVKKFFNG
ncbi:UvrD-helicase domain-containing protein [Pelistega europaea]|uniref:UvrD-helicase domain-containing protein n=1 Tax=Pelistega europaea TaxID=106147 RepID=A0A7Y4P4Q8_9BURK|nr:UvrD-helicase domain-containing protein [Pelistega europaea]NOL50322.1 UvrD-helicase domain-containing protein [Pelistega europaea]